MWEYFQGRKRKLGALVLGMTCLFAAGWVRSLTAIDGVIWGMNQTAFLAVSVDRHFGLAIAEAENSGAISRLQWSPRDFQSLDEFIEEGTKPSSHWQFAGFHVASFIIGSASAEHAWFICGPYLSVVIPLTILSAWLLLSKPRTKRSPLKHLPAMEA